MSGSQTLAPEYAEDAVDEPTGEEVLQADAVAVCAHCGAPRGDRDLVVCRRCGYHQRLGITMELDEWDREDESGQSLAPREASHLAVWLRLVPPWTWWILLCVLVIVAESVAARFATPAGSSLRTLWSLAQLGAGLGLLALAHLAAYVFAITEDDQLKPFDLLARPLHCWKPTLRALPARLGVATTAAASVTAVLMSLLVIGGLPYERLWDWGIQAPPKQNLLTAVAKQAQKVAPKNQSLEDAVQDFAGEASLEESVPALAEKPRQFAQCLIVGFLPSRENPPDFRALVVAGVVGDELREVATITVGFDAETRATLNRRMRELPRETPFVPSSQPAYWLQPRLTCRVSYTGQSKAGRLIDAQFESLLDEIDPR
jgi:hypothetical protein